MPDEIELIAPEDISPTRRDIAEFVARLPSQEREIAQALLDGITPGRIAQKHRMRRPELLKLAQKIFKPLILKLEIREAKENEKMQTP
ncbi:MAG: hypothetical protein VB042_02915 [Victivallaceae bacterium]|nr:hypothetical protein [Victivallaceae bacterium]